MKPQGLKPEAGQRLFVNGKWKGEVGQDTLYLRYKSPQDYLVLESFMRIRVKLVLEQVSLPYHKNTRHNYKVNRIITKNVREFHTVLKSFKAVLPTPSAATCHGIALQLRTNQPSIIVFYSLCLTLQFLAISLSPKMLIQILRQVRKYKEANTRRNMCFVLFGMYLGSTSKNQSIKLHIITIQMNGRHF